MTGVPATVQTYLYWSQRRIDRIAEDNGVALQRAGATKFKSPTGPFIPAVEVERPRRQMSRPDVAAKIQHYLSAATVRDFVTPPPVRFAAGMGTLTFAEFVNFGRFENIVSIFTECEASDGSQVAIGMFGSKDNLVDFISAVPTTQTGWSSSAAGHIFAFISSFGRDIDPHTSRNEIACEAINLLKHQGGSIGDGEKRGFTYGHIGDYGEWFLDAYLDIEVKYPPYDRVVLGAPLWVRTPKPQALVLYNDVGVSVSHDTTNQDGKAWWRKFLR